MYFDHAATTPLEEEVLEAMMPYLGRRFGNASSLHASGREARHAVEEARERVARSLGCEPEHVVFTSGGTESDNAAVLGVAAVRSGAVVTCATEHEAVLRPVSRLSSSGRPVKVLASRADGSIDPDALATALGEPTALVSVMHTNNETGARNDVSEISKICRSAGVPFHSDAVQATAWFEVGPDAVGADLVSLSAHKIGGPKGIGALVIRPGTPWQPMVLGGNQELRRRGGTENVAAIVGFGRAMELVRARRYEDRLRVSALRDRLRASLAAACAGVLRFVTPSDGAPHILYGVASHPAGRRVDPEMLLLRLDVEGVEASSGSACTSGALEQSHVAEALGLAGAPLRLSLGRNTTAREVDAAAEIVAGVVRSIVAAA